VFQKRGGRRGNKPREDVYRTDLVEKSDMFNERFTTYYQTQKIVPEDEWDTFMESMRAPLPTTFRVAGSRQRVFSLDSWCTGLMSPVGPRSRSMQPSATSMFRR
jgi:multisite-specific tRNA:(cytosine-C5)-methyltransferase